MSFDFTEIDGIINARSLAIVGASGAPMKFSTMFTASQMSMGFNGPIYLVNPREKEIMGRKAYPDLLSLPGPVDLVYITIPAHRSMDVLRDCAGVGARGVVMLASGFREAGEAGKDLEAEALDLAREAGFRIVGPNCFGIYNPGNGLTMLPGRDFTRTPGGCAFISQSGGFCIHVIRQCQSLGLGFSAAVSYGNAADLNESDFIRYFAQDDRTDAIGGYLEGVRDGRGFARALAEATAVKPVVLWKVGKGESSRRAVVSHTGSLAGSSEVWDSLMRQYGVIPASGVDEMCDILLALKHLGKRPGRRLLLAGGGGGLGTYAADVAEAENLEVPPLEGEPLERLRSILGRAGAVAGNPLDIGAPLIPLPEFEGAMREAANDRSTDILVFDLALNFAYDLARDEGLNIASDVLIRAKKDGGKKVVMVIYSRSCDEGNLKFVELLRRLRSRFHQAGIPVYPSMPRALRAIARVGEGNRS